MSNSLKRLAVNNFSDLISMNPAAFDTGRAVQAESTFLGFESSLQENLGIIFDMKSAAT